MTQVAAAYVPVLHEGYRRFLDAHARDKPLYLIGPELYADYRPLAKDIRALTAAEVAPAIAAWGIASEVHVLDTAAAAALAARAPRLTLPAEDVSHQVVERHFPRCAVLYDTAFLRWDKPRVVALAPPRPDRVIDEHDLPALAEAQAEHSIDFWRQVGAAIRFADGTVEATHNEHLPHPQSPYAVGDPRSNFFQGVHLELSTAMHAEARLIAAAARAGRSTRGAELYVTDFPCPPCAKLIAASGVARVHYRTGYAVLDGQDVLGAAGVEVVKIAVSV
jgi:dCMP deaminase